MNIVIDYSSAWLEALKVAYEHENGPQNVGDGVLVRKAASRAALKKIKLKPFLVKQDKRTSVRISVSHTWMNSFEKENPKTSRGNILLFAANAYLADIQNSGKELDRNVHSGSPLLPVSGLQSRPEQNKLYEFLIQKPSEKPFRVCEASTGSGKGLAIVAAAIDTKRAQPNKQIIVTAPTIVLVNQLFDSYQFLADAHALTLSASKSISTTEFVSKTLAMYWCEEHTEHPECESFRQALESTDNYHMDAFLAFDDIPLSELTLHYASGHVDASDPARQQYEEEKASSRNADIVFCTHAMLILSLLRGRSATATFKLEWEQYLNERRAVISPLPYSKMDNIKRIESSPEDAAGHFHPDPFIFVDEAHQFADIINLVNQDALSLHGLSKSLLAYKKKPDAKLQSIISLLNQLQQVVPESYDRPIQLRGSQADTALANSVFNLSNMLNAYFTPVRRQRMVRTSSGRRTLRQITIMNSIVSDKMNLAISLSPIRKYAKIISGSSNQAVLFDFMHRIASGISLTSATLYTHASQSAFGGYSYIVNQYQFPHERVEVHTPIKTDWVNQGFSFHMPSKIPEFSPVHDSFLTFCAVRLEGIAKTAEGGTMVLCTSYDQINTIAKRSNIAPERLIAQAPGQSIRSLKARYMTLYKDGFRPVWLATGAAWTGLDITGGEENPVDDKAIQNLVVLKLPFEVVSEDVPVGFAVSRCVFKLKQGIGRLVRRSGRKEMNIYLLDNRIYSQESIYKPINQFLKSEYMGT